MYGSGIASSRFNAWLSVADSTMHIPIDDYYYPYQESSVNSITTLGSTASKEDSAIQSEPKMPSNPMQLRSLAHNVW